MLDYRSTNYKVKAGRFLPDADPPEIPDNIFMDRGGTCQLRTPVGNYAIQPGEWVLAYPNGDHWRCSDEEFSRGYEEYEESCWGNHLEIEGKPGGRFKLRLNGMDVIVNGVELVMGVGEVPIARLIMDLDHVSVDTEMLAYLTAKFGTEEGDDDLET